MITTGTICACMRDAAEALARVIAQPAGPSTKSLRPETTLEQTVKDSPAAVERVMALEEDFMPHE